MTQDLSSIGMTFPRWQDAVEQAVSSNRLGVVGEVRGGQLVAAVDSSGARLTVLAVEPFATFAGFDGATEATAHVQMLNDVVALCDVVTDDGDPIATVTCNLAQGPLIVDEPVFNFERINLSALGVDVAFFDDADTYTSATGGAVGVFASVGAGVVARGDGSQSPNAAANLVLEVKDAHYRFNTMTNQRFVHLDVVAPFPLDVVVSDVAELPTPGSIIAGTFTLSGSIIAPAGCGDSCGSGGCACGSGGCGSHG